MNEDIFYSFKEKVKVTRIFFSILVIGGGYAIYSIRESIFYWYIYVLFFYITGVCYLFINIKSYFGKAPGVYLNSDELIIKAPASTINVNWGDIKSFQCFDRGSYSFVSVILFDNEKFLRQRNIYSRWIRKRLLKKFEALILMPVNFFNVSRTELLSELNYRLEKYRNEKRI